MDTNTVGPAQSWRLIYDESTGQAIAILNTHGKTSSIYTIEEFETPEQVQDRIDVLGLLMPPTQQNDLEKDE